MSRQRPIKRRGLSVLLALTLVVGPGGSGAAEQHNDLPPTATGSNIVQLAMFNPRNGEWHLRFPGGMVKSFFFGVPGDVPLMGDWDCDGTDTVAMFRPSNGFIYLRNSNTFGVADRDFFFGIGGDVPLAGDWNGDGCDTFSIYRQSEGKVYISNQLGTRAAEYSFHFGISGDLPFAGDFDGDGIDTVGLYRDTTGFVYVRDALSTGIADYEFYYGVPSDRIMAGDWDRDGDDTVGIFRPGHNRFYLSFENRQGHADVEIYFGEADWLPVAWGAATPFPPVIGPDPSYRVATFYYPWFGNPDDAHGYWLAWDDPQGGEPPADISSDYYPVLGPYSSIDPTVVAQHFAWLREAGVGVIISSWWGSRTQGLREDEAVPLLLEIAERYDIQVAFHIEPYFGRTATTLVDDVEYLYQRYGTHPAFFRSTARTQWSDDDRPKGVFFVWLANYPDGKSDPVDPSYWAAAIDEIHASPNGGLILSDRAEGVWVTEGHFDGTYQYATLETSPSFAWARSLPDGALYVPSVLPGFSAKRISFDQSEFVARAGGNTYRQQWEGALGTGIEPAMVSITSFNEWHEGTQIEPAATGVARASGAVYDDYGELGPEGYLELTAGLVKDFLEIDWDQRRAKRVRIQIETTSDWTTLTLESGAELAQPVTVSVSDSGSSYFEPNDEGGRVDLLQPLEDAEQGRSAQVVMELRAHNWVDPLRFVIERGALGYTEITITGLVDGAETGSKTVLWDGWSDALVGGEFGRNPLWFEVTAAELGV